MFKQIIKNVLTNFVLRYCSMGTWANDWWKLNSIAIGRSIGGLLEFSIFPNLSREFENLGVSNDTS